MNIQLERRVPEARGLRVLFEQQFTHLTDLLDAWSSRRVETRAHDEQLDRAVDTVVEGTDARIRCVSRYKKTLRASVRGVLLHVEALVDGLPPAITVNRRSFATDPQINALFVNAQDLQRVFSSSRELQAFFSRRGAAGPQQACALLFARKQEKHGFGNALVGDMLLRDVQQTTVNFSDHRILSPSADEGRARQALKETVFDCVVAYVREEMARRGGSLVAHGMVRVAARSPDSLANPEVYLGELVRMLEQPRRLLGLEHNRLTISKLGIKITEANAAPANELQLHELAIGQRAREIVTLVTYPRDEMLTLEELRRDALRAALHTPR